MKKFVATLIFFGLIIRLFILHPPPTPEGVVADYAQAFKNTPMLAAIKEDCTEKGIDISVRSQGTTIILEYQYIDEILGGSYVYDQLKSQLQTYINSTENNQQVTLALMKADCPYITSLKQNFYDNRGVLLASGEVE